MRRRRRELLLLGGSIWALPLLAVSQMVAVTEGTITKVDADGKRVMVAATDGVERTFVFVDHTSVHGFEGLGKAPKDSLHGLREGCNVAVHYTTRSGVDTAEEIDHIGQGGLRVLEGTIRHIDRGIKEIRVATADGAEKTFHLMDRAASDTGKEIASGTEKSAKVNGLLQRGRRQTSRPLFQDPHLTGKRRNHGKIQREKWSELQ